MNLLTRLNRELGANFQLDQFDFYASYHPETGEVKSYLVSLEEQTVEIPTLEKCYHFEKDELIYTELSKKYSIPEMSALAVEIGFMPTQHFTDKGGLFCDSLWRKA